MEKNYDYRHYYEWREIDPEKFIRYFRAVFEKTGFLEHYKEMIDEVTAANGEGQFWQKTTGTVFALQRRSLN